MEELCRKSRLRDVFLEKAKISDVRSFMVLFLVLFIVLPALAVDPVKVVEWKLDEVGGAALDTSWNGNDSTDFEALGSWQKNPRRTEGLAGNCAVFRGAFPDDSDLAYLTKNAALNLPVDANAPWSINMYVFIDVGQGPTNAPIGGFGGTQEAVANKGKGRYVFSSDHSIAFWAGYGTGDANMVNTGVSFSVSKWQMITVTYDGTTTKIYKDGALIGSSTSLVYVTLPSTTPKPKATLSPFMTFRGSIDEFTVWSGALQQAAITNLASLVKTPGDLNGNRKVDMVDFAIMAGNWLGM
jgi:hypothetical protein